MREQLVQLSQSFPRWRRVRGDGNCYYRALMFGLCEHCLYKPQRMRQLKKLVRDTKALPGTYLTARLHSLDTIYFSCSRD
jgi:hypothetical protein